MTELLDRLHVAIIANEQSKHSFHAPLLVRALEQLDRIAGSDDAVLHDPIVPAATTCPDDFPDHILVTEAVPEFPARLPALAHLQDCSAQAESVADADVRFGDAERRDVLAESPGHVELPGQSGLFLTPLFIVIKGVVQYCFVDTTVIFEIGLAVTCESKRMHLDRTCDGRLEVCTRLSLRTESSYAPKSYFFDSNSWEHGSDVLPLAIGKPQSAEDHE